ncbi:unnamed protein product [Linum tenue]|uniref:Alcohol dehydrogenase superfamily, zinc-type n=1 Tax=Linum tenue TaxID=586396 RepID=A0AAV0N9R0_9ROSI|nr:unnamed protein product [Linum tenue]
MSSSTVTVPTKMKGWVYSEYGDPAQVLKLESEVPVPDVKEDQVLVKVVAAALNLLDYKRMEGAIKATDSSPPLEKHVFGSYKVAATSSTSKLERLKSMGADLAIDYTKQNVEELDHKFDVVFDTVQNGTAAVNAAKSGGGRVVAILPVPPPASWFVVTSKGSALEKLKPYLESGEVKPLIDPNGPFPFSQTLEAFSHLMTGRATGKVVVHPLIYIL